MLLSKIYIKNNATYRYISYVRLNNVFVIICKKLQADLFQTKEMFLDSKQLLFVSVTVFG